MTKPPRRRSGTAIAAQHRNAGPMKDRRAPRGGQRNEQRDLLDEALDEMCPWCKGTGVVGQGLDCGCDNGRVPKGE